MEEKLHNLINQITNSPTTKDLDLLIKNILNDPELGIEALIFIYKHSYKYYGYDKTYADLELKIQQAIYEHMISQASLDLNNNIGTGVIITYRYGEDALRQEEQIQDCIEARRKLWNSNNTDGKVLHYLEKISTPIVRKVPIYGDKQVLNEGSKLYYISVKPNVYDNILETIKNSKVQESIFTDRCQAKKVLDAMNIALAKAFGYSPDVEFLTLGETDFNIIKAESSKIPDTTKGTHIKTGYFAEKTGDKKLVKHLSKYEYEAHKLGIGSNLHSSNNSMNFAILLHDIFDYEIQIMRCVGIPHSYLAYNIMDIDGKRHYISAYGITDNFEEMYESTFDAFEGRDYIIEEPKTILQCNYTKEQRELVTKAILSNPHVYYWKIAEKNDIETNEIKHTLYYELSESKKRKNLYKQIDFGARREIDGAIYLRGYCPNFALELAEKYGYKIEAAYCRLGLLHAYCTTEVNGEKFYIDVRGITNDWNEFMSCFGNEPYTISNLGAKLVHDNYNKFRKEASIIIDNAPNTYSVEKFINKFGHGSRKK